MVLIAAIFGGVTVRCLFRMYLQIWLNYRKRKKGTGSDDVDEEELLYFDALEGYDIFHDSVETQEPFSFDNFEDSLPHERPVSQAFVSALATADEDTLGDNKMSTFDTSSSFWVCDNSATGHICNDKSKY